MFRFRIRLHSHLRGGARGDDGDVRARHDHGRHHRHGDGHNARHRHDLPRHAQDCHGRGGDDVHVRLHHHRRQSPLLQAACTSRHLHKRSQIQSFLLRECQRQEHLRGWSR